MKRVTPRRLARVWTVAFLAGVSLYFGVKTAVVLDAALTGSPPIWAPFQPFGPPPSSVRKNRHA